MYQYWLLVREIGEDFDFGAQRKCCDFEAFSPRANTSLSGVIRNSKSNERL
jgi:hypothetical protein